MDSSCRIYDGFEEWPSFYGGFGMGMLVLSRAKNDSIVIDGAITVTVLEIRGAKVRLGITAPKQVPVHRQEVQDAIMAKLRPESAPPSVAS